MASFAERLRMQSLYGGRKNPFTPKDTSPLPLLDQMIKRLPSDQPSPTNRLQTIAENLEPERQKQVTVQQSISPYQQAVLEQRRQELESKGQLAEKGFESREKIAGEREETRRTGLDIQQQRADAYKFRSENPNVKFVIDKVSGNMTAINSATGAPVRDFGKTQLGQEELINLNAEKAEKLEDKRQEGRETLADVNARHRRELEEFKAQQPSRSSGLPTQKLKQVELNYNLLINRRPDLAKFVERDPFSKEVKINKAGRESATPAQLEEINGLLFGSGKEVEKGDIHLPAETKKEETPEERMARLKKAAGVK